MSKRSPEEWANKVEWEGGLEEMIHYGGPEIIREYDFSDEVINAWENFCDAHDKLEKALIAERGITEC